MKALYILQLTVTNHQTYVFIVDYYLKYKTISNKSVINDVELCGS